MKPIIFVRVADMKYYKGVTEEDVPHNGGAYVELTRDAHESYNFEEVHGHDGSVKCYGYFQRIGCAKNKEPEMHIENIPGCELAKRQEKVEDVIVVWCAKSGQSDHMRVVGFYKSATAYRFTQTVGFDNCDDLQDLSFVAKQSDCILLPCAERNKEKWFVPLSGEKGITYGFGRSNIWYAGSKTKDTEELHYVEEMIKNVEAYQGENWIEKRGDRS